jgi:hypothetical protein
MSYTPDSTETSLVSISGHEFEDDESGNDNIDGGPDDGNSDDKSDNDSSGGARSNAPHGETYRCGATSLLRTF